MALLALSRADSRRFAENPGISCDVARICDVAGVDDVRRLMEEERSFVIATAGSSGIPKRVVLSAAALRASAEATAARVGQGRWVLALPTDYVAGLQVLVRSLLAGTEPIALEGKFTADAFLAASREKGLLTALVPAQLATLVDAAEHRAEVRAAASGYRAILVGGQATPLPLRERAAELGIPIVRTYGSTETSGGCVYDGVPLDGVRLAAFEGELRIAGPTLAEGYLGDEALTARAFVEQEGTRWYRTGDLGAIENGAVSVLGRADNVIVSGGINVSLDRVERVVQEIPGFAEAVVVGVDDERWGQASVVVTGNPDAAAQLARIRSHVGEALGAPARPREIRTLAEVPRLPSGKPDRQALAVLLG